MVENWSSQLQTSRRAAGFIMQIGACWIKLSLTNLIISIINNYIDVEIVKPQHRVWYAVMTPIWYNIGYITVPIRAYAIRDYQKLLIPA